MPNTNFDDDDNFRKDVDEECKGSMNNSFEDNSTNDYTKPSFIKEVYENTGGAGGLIGGTGAAYGAKIISKFVPPSFQALFIGVSTLFGAATGTSLENHYNENPTTKIIESGILQSSELQTHIQNQDIQNKLCDERFNQQEIIITKLTEQQQIDREFFEKSLKELESLNKSNNFEEKLDIKNIDKKN